MSWLAGPYLATAVLLVVAGGPKVAQPDSAVRALASVRWAAWRTLVRLLGLVEVLIGLAALLIGGPVPAVLMGVSYAAFSCFVTLALLRGGVLSSCGCFGKADTPPTHTHLAVTLCSAVIALAVAARPIGPSLAVMQSTPAAGLPLLGFAALGVWFSYLLLAVLPHSSGRAIARAAEVRRT
jgi:hypothetical protein